MLAIILAGCVGLLIGFVAGGALGAGKREDLERDLSTRRGKISVLETENWELRKAEETLRKKLESAIDFLDDRRRPRV